jgi:hypothetical protein
LEKSGQTLPMNAMTLCAAFSGFNTSPYNFLLSALPLAFIGAAILFLPLFIFLPRLIRSAMKADTDAVLEVFGKNGQTRKVCRALFVATAGLVLAQVVDPKAAQKIAEVLAGLVP